MYKISYLSSGVPVNRAKRIICAVIVLAGASFTSAHAVNTGQDPTNPVTRLDVRWEDDALPYDLEGTQGQGSDTIILRTDMPIPLGNKGSGGVLALRMDLPFTSSKTTDPITGATSGNVGFGSVYLQFLHVTPKSWGRFWGNDAWAWGYAMQAPTSTFGRQNRTNIAMFGSKWGLSETNKGDFFASVLKYYNADADPDNSFDKLNEFHFQPIFNWNIKTGISFVSLWANYDWVYNFEDGVFGAQTSGDYFIPYDITVGKMLSGGKVVLSATVAGKLASSDNYDLYDDRIMVRVGFFF